MDRYPTLVAQSGATIGLVRVFVVLVEETPGRSVWKLPSSPDSGTYQTIAGAAPRAGVVDVVDSLRRWLGRLMLLM